MTAQNNIQPDHPPQAEQEEQAPTAAKTLAMMEEIMVKWEIIKETNISDRPKLPKIYLNMQARSALETANKAITEIKDKQTHRLSLSEVNQLYYASALAISDTLGIKQKQRQKTTRPKQDDPLWKKRLRNQIKNIRGEISSLSELKRGTEMRKKKRRKIKRRYQIRNERDISTATERLKQQLMAKAQRIRRYDKRQKFYHQNKTYTENTKKFYRDLGKKNIEVEQIPESGAVENFWANIWEKKKQHNDKAEWIKQIENDNKETPEHEWPDITTNETKTAIQKSSSWKAPGQDGIANFWLKHITALHEDLTHAYNTCIKHPEQSPGWLTSGTTFLLPKTTDTANPKNYRPITCLPTMYKILTSILTERTYQHLIQNSLLPAEQKGCKRGSYGCKDQLLINKVIVENAKSRKKNLTTAWVDYKKAFDSVPHSWIIKCLKLYKVSPIMTKFMENIMTNWTTTLQLSHSKGTLTSRGININSGIFQGDSLSPLLFCIALAPLSSLLNRSKYGYKTGNTTINHLFYMDDLKTYAKNDHEQENILTIVKGFSDDIKMEFGLEKCAKATFKKGKLTATKYIQLDQGTIIQDLNQEGTYKYLGINEGDGIQHAKMKEKIRKEYFRRVRLVLQTELNAANKIEAINTLAIPVVTYSFNIINWNMEDLKKIDRKTRKHLTMANMHHPKADVDRIYLPRTEGGRGLCQIETTFKTTTIGLDTYLHHSQDPLLKIVKEHDSTIHSKATKFRREIGRPETELETNDSVTIHAKKTKKKAKEQALEQMKNNWQDKPLHGQYPKRVNDADVDKEQTHKWLRSSGLKAETEGFIIAAQDQCLKTNNYRNKILKDGTNPMCRICNKHPETIDHLVSGCPELAKTEYIQRHNKAAAYIHWAICKHYNIKVPDKHYKHQPTTVTENQQVTVLWDMPIQTDRQINANRPDIVVKDKATKTCLLIDMSIPTERNISVKTTEKLSKYKDLELEIARMWGAKTATVPAVIGALGLIKKGIGKHLDKIPGKIRVEELQKTVLLGTAHILRKTLSL